MPKDGKLLGTILWTYCPLDGRRDLPAMNWRGQVWVFCPNGASNPGEAHTAFPIEQFVENNDLIERVPVLQETPPVPEVSNG